MRKLTSWISYKEDCDFSIYNIPFGIFSTKNKSPRLGIAIGDKVLDLAGVAKQGFFDKIKIDKKVFSQNTLNDFISTGKPKTKKVRLTLQKLLSGKSSALQDFPKLFHNQSAVKMHLPVAIGDYTDFYSSIEHATNVGMMFRDPANALLPNWRHIPVGYHGRSSSIIVSGENIKRPKGQLMMKDAKRPVYKPSQRVDFELEMGFIIGKDSALGKPVSIEKAEDHIFGLALFNDWSARDIQKWEYVPLGPFLGKNFASSLSPWIVTLEALDPFRVQGPKQKPAVQPYLKYSGLQNYDINLDVSITPNKGSENIVSHSNFKFMYWNMIQQLAHHTVNGCNVRVGDLMASGTISGKDVNSYGSMLEIAWAGSKPITLNDGTQRKFINDNDTVTMRGYAEKEGVRVGFGEVKAKILPSD